MPPTYVSETFSWEFSKHASYGVTQSVWLFHDGGRYHIVTSPLIFSANQWTGFYMITASVMEELKVAKKLLQTLKKISCKNKAKEKFIKT